MTFNHRVQGSIPWRFTSTLTREVNMDIGKVTQIAVFEEVFPANAEIPVEDEILVNEEASEVPQEVGVAK